MTPPAAHETGGEAELPEAAWRAALASLPGMTAARLRRLLAGRAAAEAFGLIRAGGPSAELLLVADRGGRSPEAGAGLYEDEAPGDGGGRADQARTLAVRWQAAAQRLDVVGQWAALAAAGVRVLVPGAEGYPERLAADHDRPEVLFACGEPAVLRRPAVAIVGTRRCTTAGRLTARELGHACAELGLLVVSGLALGIDGAAHEGALEVPGAAVAGVVGSGLDVVYPRRHHRLWQRVAATGVLLSEYPLGSPPEAWHFPARNRILAALATVVAVVESHLQGGSLVTARLAFDRARPVLAVPGSVRSPAASGTNALLRDGAVPLLDLDDLVAAFALEGVNVHRPAPADDPRPQLDAEAAAVLEAVWWGESSSTSQVISRTGLSPAVVARALHVLAEAGQVAGSGGFWERVGRG